MTQMLQTLQPLVIHGIVSLIEFIVSIKPSKQHLRGFIGISATLAFTSVSL